jgi:hypothetical protein
MEHPSEITFLALPLEIRNKIYHLVLSRERPVRICSPRRSPTTKAIWFKSTTGILYVNKQIHAEAFRVFICSARFSIGNGMYRSSGDVNLHAFKSFLAHVPRSHISLISEINLIVYKGNYNVFTQAIRRRHLPGRKGHGFWPESAIRKCKGGFCKSGDESDLRIMCRMLEKYFTSLKAIDIQFASYWTSNAVEMKPLSQGDALREFTKIVRTLVELPHLRKITIRRCP